MVWLVDASLKWLPGFRSSFVSTIQEAADGQPAWLHGWFTFWFNLTAPRAALFAHMVAVIETGIALALILGFARKVTYLFAIPFTLMIWATAEGFGGPYASGSSDIGTAIIYAVVFLALIVIEVRTEPSRYTADAWLARRWPGWRRFAELGEPTVEDRAPQGSGREIIAMVEGEAS
jgi:nitrite reductase (NO-forming)